jgi:Fe-S-cluster containining protein
VFRFECQKGCTACCDQKGYVNLTESDIHNIAAFLNMEPSDFERAYIERKPYLRRLRTGRHQPCPFLKDAGCSIHPVKPAQCRLFPFWPNIASSAGSWQQTGAWCPGIGQGPLVQIETVQAAMAEMRQAYPGFYDE